MNAGDIRCDLVQARDKDGFTCNDANGWIPFHIEFVHGGGGEATIGRESLKECQVLGWRELKRAT